MTNKKSEIYWRDRIAEEIRFKTIQDKSILAVYDQLYRQHWDAIEKEIQAFYQRYGDKHGLDPAKVKERVSEMDVRAFESKAKQYVREKDFSDRANEELALYNLKMKVSRGELLQYYLDLEMVALTDGEHKLTERFLSDEYVSELQRQAGILGQSLPSPQAIKEQTQTIINIPFHGATWSARIWDRQDQLRVIVQRFMEKALYRGWSPLRLIPQLRKEFKASVYEAKRLAITELARVQTEAQKQAYLNSGFDRYIYMAEPSACRICADFDGKDFKVSEMTPGHNAAPMHPHCRCSTAPYADREELERMFEQVGDYYDQINPFDGEGTELKERRNSRISYSSETRQFEKAYNRGRPVRAKRVIGREIPSEMYVSEKLRNKKRAVRYHANQINQAMDLVTETSGLEQPTFVILDKSEMNPSRSSIESPVAVYADLNNVIYLRGDIYSDKLMVQNQAPIFANHYDPMSTIIHELGHWYQYQSLKTKYPEFSRNQLRQKEIKNSMQMIDMMAEDGYNIAESVSEYSYLSFLKNKHYEVFAESFVKYINGNKTLKKYLLKGVE